MGGVLVYILGRSGTGKSYSLRNFPKDKVAVINVQGKILPFRGSGSIEQTSTDNSLKILKALDIYAQQYKSIVVDDYQYVMSNEFMRRSAERGYDKFTEIARHAWDIAQKVRELPDDVIVYIMCHTDRDDEGNEKIKTIGKLLDEKICLEGLSTIVLKTNVSDGQYTFLTQNNGKDTVKSPADMFPSYAIDNDLWYVDQKIRNYYYLPGAADDATVAAMEQKAAKPDIKKDAEGKQRRRRTQTTETTAVETVNEEVKQSVQVTETATEAVVQREEEKVDDGEKIKQATEAPAKEKKEETGTKRRRKTRSTDGSEGAQAAVNESQEETPVTERKRRRKAHTQQKETDAAKAAEAEIDQFLNISEGIEDEELPFA